MKHQDEKKITYLCISVYSKEDGILFNSKMSPKSVLTAWTILNFMDLTLRQGASTTY